MNELIVLLKKEPAYRKLATANFISGMGDWFSSVAILSLLLQLTGSGMAVGITLAARTLPFLVMGPVGGILADRYNKKTILLISDFSRIGLALSLLLVDSSEQVGIAYTATVGLVIFSALSLPARQSLIPQIVRKENLQAANAFDQTLGGMNMTLGAVLGGGVSAILGPQWSFLLNALTFLVSGLLVWRMPFSQATRKQELPSKEHETSAFWKTFRRSMLMKVIAIQSIAWAIGGGAINVLISVYGYQVFGAGDRGVGILYGSLGVGFVVGGILAPYFKRWSVQTVILGAAVEGIAHIGVGTASYTSNVECKGKLV